MQPAAPQEALHGPDGQLEDQKEGIGPTLGTDSLQCHQDSIKEETLTLSNLEVEHPRPVYLPRGQRKDSYPIPDMMCVETDEAKSFKGTGLIDGTDEAKRDKEKVKMLRSPLQDCIDLNTGSDHDRGIKGTSGAKGQWKRKAGMVE